eukprot:gnl/Chilomastix_caulleri/1790.p1 GENE.gnl/Chilomastix_caulleri/1790~~gnl/Chilomastix_caulleri/1790.p1  ORF type:complete len:85 (+),score=31.28 gnl/Chilomastix_caulleri/1790:271-525(+)
MSNPYAKAAYDNPTAQPSTQAQAEQGETNKEKSEGGKQSSFVQKGSDVADEAIGDFKGHLTDFKRSIKRELSDFKGMFGPSKKD